MATPKDPSELIERQIKGLRDWRGKLMARLRTLIRKADPEITEGWKWGTAVWLRGGMVCAVGAFADHVKVNFFQGAALDDPYQLFNAGLEAKKSRAIDFHQGDRVNGRALKQLVRAAVEHNLKGVRP